MSAPRRGDALGRALVDYLEDRGGGEIVERDDGYIAAVSAADSLYFAEYDEWPMSERKALRYARGRVLDVGCGAGRVALYLQDRGREVVGIDVSPLAVEVCRRRGVGDCRLMGVEDIDASLGVFDTVVMYGGNLGLLSGRRKAPRILKLLHAATSEDGRIIAGCRDPYGTDEPDHLAYHRRNRSRGRMAGQVRIRVRYRNLATGWFDYLLVSERELRGLLRGTGWTLSEIFRDADQYAAVIDKK